MAVACAWRIKVETIDGNQTHYITCIHHAICIIIIWKRLIVYGDYSA